MMKLLLCLFVFVVFGNDVLASQASCVASNPALQVELSSAKTIFSLRESINLSIKIRNSGTEAIILSPFMELESYWLKFEVIDSRGRRVRWLGPEVKMIETTDRVALYGGYYWGRQIMHFEKSYDLSHIGEYRVRAVFGVGPDGRCLAGKATSNILRLTVK
jgi:hypothetical protein